MENVQLLKELLLESKAMEKAQLLKELRAAFPDAWFKDGAEFNGRAAVWSGEGGEVDGDAAFDPYRAEWNFGAHPDLAEFVESRGYYWEAHDNGTFLAYKM